MIIGTVVCLMVLVTIGYFVVLLGGESVRAIMIRMQSSAQNRRIRSRRSLA